MRENVSLASSGKMPSVVADHLRHEIVEGRMEPGDRINVRQLGQLLSVSAIPIREALRLLESEGMVETIPNVGAIVANVSLLELEAVYDLRRLIEPAIACRSVGNMSDDHRATLRKTLDELVSVERNGENINTFILTHRRFHWELLAPGATPLVEITRRRLWRISERYVALTRRTALPVADIQHEQMVELCARHDGDGLADLISTHLLLTAKSVAELFGKNSDVTESVSA
jgi:DNA-binding GntR family transcriptional regulator